MRTTTNLGLAVYESNDKFRILEQTNSLNKNMEILDEAVLPIDATWGDIEEEEEE